MGTLVFCGSIFRGQIFAVGRKGGEFCTLQVSRCNIVLADDEYLLSSDKVPMAVIKKARNLILGILLSVMFGAEPHKTSKSFLRNVVLWR